MTTIEELEGRVRVLEASVATMERMFGNALLSGGLRGQAPEGEGGASDEFEPRLLAMLTTKQHVALQMLMQGKSNADIAERFCVTENGAKVYLRAIYKKFGVNTRSQAVMAVYEEWDKVSPGRYLALTKGVPKDWGDVYLNQPLSDDPYRGLYSVEKE